MWKPFTKNQSIAPALQAFRELDVEMFRTHIAQLNDAEQRALQFIKRSLEQDSPAHLELALEMKQPFIVCSKRLSRVKIVSSYSRCY